MECRHCKRIINNIGSLAAHEMCCIKNPNRIKHKSGPGAGAQKGYIPWNKGLTKQTDIRVKKSAEIFHNNYINGEYLKPLGIARTEEKEKERRKKISILTNIRYKNGWLPKAGRCKKIKYTSPTAGDILVDGSWELLVAKYLDSIKVNWFRNKTRFCYKNLNGEDSFYTPDFFVKNWDVYIEVKGYETDLDRCKWSQFPYKIEIWKKEKINKIKNILLS